jgi:hypothetical protein
MPGTRHHFPEPVDDDSVDRIGPSRTWRASQPKRGNSINCAQRNNDETASGHCHMQTFIF